MSEHEHDRFLYEKDGALHFGCINPFCGHGDPALPKHYRIPLDTFYVVMKLISHEGRELKIDVTPKASQYAPAILTTEDNLEACAKGFKELVFSKK